MPLNKETETWTVIQNKNFVGLQMYGVWIKGCWTINWPLKKLWIYFEYEEEILKSSLPNPEGNDLFILTLIVIIFHFY